ncbi:hypothetical protein B0H66DRAFT_75087 [Apodospora peruviana]|uniref:Uncharacterized protein n=1 Tax=Apodospora peruviana TaxID=516989 RepID=A0AAE0ITG0_9PEZI|nr:hypothetical protein B0H66DRAFT_75087 [Apodospora peruviana]
MIRLMIPHQVTGKATARQLPSVLEYVSSLAFCYVPVLIMTTETNFVGSCLLGEGVFTRRVSIRKWSTSARQAAGHTDIWAWRLELEAGLETSPILPALECCTYFQRPAMRWPRQSSRLNLTLLPASPVPWPGTGLRPSFSCLPTQLSVWRKTHLDQRWRLFTQPSPHNQTSPSPAEPRAELARSSSSSRLLFAQGVDTSASRA